MKKRKHAMTLLEIMVVIFLIGIIGSVIGYNMKGSLAKGKQFRTEQAAAKIKEVLTLETELHMLTPKEVVKDYKEVLKKSGMVKNVDTIIVDGWGNDFSVVYEDNEYVVYSSKFTKADSKKI